MVSDRNSQGVVLALTAVLLPILFGIAALAIDISFYLNRKIAAQRAADTAALSAVFAAFNATGAPSATSTTILAAGRSAAFDIASQNGFPDNPKGNVRVYVNSPPQYAKSGFLNDGSAFEVTVNFPLPTFYSIFNGSNFLASSARAVGLGVTPCLLALGGSYNIGTANDIAIEIAANANVVANCGLFTNSPFKTVDRSSGSVRLNANTSKLSLGSVIGNGVLKLFGGSTATGGSFNNISPAAQISALASQIPDPFNNSANNFLLDQLSSLTSPKSITSGLPKIGCNQSAAFLVSKSSYYNSKTRSAILPSANYTCGLSVDVPTTLNANSIFYIDGPVSVKGNSSLNGIGTTIILGANGILNSSGNYSISLVAPLSGTWRGVAIYQNSSLGNAKVSYITLGNTFAVKGAVDLPQQKIQFQGGSATVCTFYIARNFYFQGGGTIANACTINTSMAGFGAALLVE